MHSSIEIRINSRFSAKTSDFDPLYFVEFLRFMKFIPRAQRYYISGRFADEFRGAREGSRLFILFSL
jgi:hypothetical protein